MWCVHQLCIVNCWYCRSPHSFDLLWWDSHPWLDIHLQRNTEIWKWNSDKCGSLETFRLYWCLPNPGLQPDVELHKKQSKIDTSRYFQIIQFQTFTGKSIARALLYLTWGRKAKQMPADYFSWEWTWGSETRCSEKEERWQIKFEMRNFQYEIFYRKPLGCGSVKQ